MEAGGAQANVVLTLGGADLGALSRLALRHLLRLEAERRATILWNSRPTGSETSAAFRWSISMIGGRQTCSSTRWCSVSEEGMATFSIVSVSSSMASTMKRCTCSTRPRSREWLRRALLRCSQEVPGRRSRAKHFPNLPATEVRPRVWRLADRAQFEELRGTHYNASITEFERSHSDLWLLRVKPDHGTLITWRGNTPPSASAIGNRGPTVPATRGWTERGNG